MANARIRFTPIYFKNKKVAELQSVDYEIASGDESQVGTEGYIGHSDGATLVSLTASCIVPVAGVSVTFVSSLVNKEYVQVGIPIDGKIHQFAGRIVSASYKSDAKSGRTTGDFKFEGGPPQLTG